MSLASIDSNSPFRGGPPVTLSLSISLALELRHGRGDPKKNCKEFWSRVSDLHAACIKSFSDTIVDIVDDKNRQLSVSDVSPDVRLCHTAAHGLLLVRELGILSKSPASVTYVQWLMSNIVH